MIIGLATSNPAVFTVVFTAHHILHPCKLLSSSNIRQVKLTKLGGSYIKDPREREAIFQMLETFTKALGWKTEPLACKLRKEWY